MDSFFESSIIFESECFALKYSGPDINLVSRIVVSFPHLYHPLGFNTLGWGESFFSKRRQPAVYLLVKKANWFQSEGFFDAMRAIRSFTGKSVKITTYGASMGGYGAILAAKALAADIVLALCPQFSIQQDIVPFERRYRAEAKEIGNFLYDVNSEIDDKIKYIVIYDPMHRRDRRHVALFKPTKYRTLVPCPGSGHGVLETIFQSGQKEGLLDLALHRISPQVFRRNLRAGRKYSIRYIKRMAGYTTGRHGGFAKVFIQMAREMSRFDLVENWQRQVYENEKYGNIDTPPRKRVIIHLGLPGEGHGLIQKYFKTTLKKYVRQKVVYPIESIEPEAFNHRWLSQCLREDDSSNLAGHINRMAQEATVLILSDDELYSVASVLPPSLQREVKEAFEPFNVRIIYCHRSLEKWKKSLYIYALKNKTPLRSSAQDSSWAKDLTFREFFSDASIKKLADYEKCIGELADIFGADSVHSLDAEGERDILHSFCEAAGLQFFEVSPAKTKGSSISDLDGEILRQANQLPRHQITFIRKLLSLSVEFDAREARPNKVKRLAALGGEMKWNVFSYKPNPPLKYTKRAFCDRVLALERLARQIELAAMV